MQKYIVILFLIVFSGASILAQTAKLRKNKLTDKITIFIPEDFQQMPDNAYAREYGAYRKPIAMFTSANGEADFGVNMNQNRIPTAYTQSEFKLEDLQMLKDMYKGSIDAMHAEVKFFQDKIETINKRKYIILEFVGVVKDEDTAFTTGKVLKQYSYLQYTVEEDKVLVFNFTCPYRYKERWQNVAGEMMQRVKVGDFTK